MKALKTLAVAIVIALTLFATGVTAFAAERGPVTEFTPDGVELIPMPGYDIELAHVPSYLNDFNHTPDGIQNLMDV